MFSRLAFAALLLLAPATAGASPPWISIELPANPWDRDTRGAFLVVHAFHHGAVVDDALPVGTAEGIVNGQRRSVTLRFQKTGRPGVYALQNQWGGSGRWVLLISLGQSAEEHSVAQAVVTVAEDGTVSSVRVPTEATGDGNLPRRATPAEIAAALTPNARP